MSPEEITFRKTVNHLEDKWDKKGLKSLLSTENDSEKKSYIQSALEWIRARLTLKSTVRRTA